MCNLIIAILVITITIIILDLDQSQTVRPEVTVHQTRKQAKTRIKAIS